MPAITNRLDDTTVYSAKEQDEDKVVFKSLLNHQSKMDQILTIK
jgi:hypothetical protein